MTPQRAFLAGEFFSLSLQGATQRAGIWAEGVPEADRRELHFHLRDLLESLLDEYVRPVDDTAHAKSIERIANSLTRRHSGLLADRRFRIGPTQRALNLYLKYMWCAGEIVQPPHCPIDSLVIKAAKLPKYMNWTQMHSIKEYTNLIAALRAFAAPLPLAEWELREWVRRDA